MDGFEDLDLDEIEFAPMEAAGERLLLLTLDEAHDLLSWLRLVTVEGGAHAPEAGRWATAMLRAVSGRQWLHALVPSASSRRASS